MRFINSVYSGLLLNILFPGIAHIYFREYVFGLFVFLIWLIASVIFYVSFVIDFSSFARLALFGLPLIFYFFTFFDLSNSLKKKKRFPARRWPAAMVFYGAAFLYQVFSPTAPVNFWINNSPKVFILENNRLSPFYPEGTVMKASPLEYKVKIGWIKQPFVTHLPERYELIRCRLDDGAVLNGMVLGLPGEDVELTEGELLVNGTPDFEGWLGGFTLIGDVPLTRVNQYSILVATMNLGAVDRTFQVTLQQIEGKIEKLF